MGTKMVRIEDGVYEMIRTKKRDDETFSDAIERLIGGGSLLDLYGLSEDEDIEEMREAIGETKEQTRERVDELRERADTE